MARGRPPGDPRNTKSIHVGLRITPLLHDRLLAAAKERERSVSEEINLRLRRSFEDPEQPIKDRFGGPTPYWFFLIIANQLRTLERFTGERWWQDPYTHRQAKILFQTFIDCFKPAGRARRPSRFSRIEEPLGRHLAERELANIEATLLDPNPPIGVNWGGMLVTEWREVAELFNRKLKSSPLTKLYGIERTKK